MTPAAAALDTSVTLRLLRDHGDEAQESADRVAVAIEDGSMTAYVLDLCVYEMVHVMARGWGLDASLLEEALGAFFDLEFPVIEMTRELALSAAAISAEIGLSGYDAAHLAAARMMEMPLITADRELASAEGAVLLSSL